MSAEASGPQITVLVVDDQAPFRRAARAVLRETPAFELIAEATSGEEAVAAARELGPDVVLMDVNMPVMDGVAATRLITQHHATVRVVALTSDLAAVGPMLRAGAERYVLKGDRDALVEALERTARG